MYVRFWPDLTYIDVKHHFESLVATIHFSPFTCCFRGFSRPSFTAFFAQRERRIHTITLVLTVHCVSSRVNGSLITPITFTDSL